MSKSNYRYTFSPEIPFGDVEESLILATITAESVFGRSQVRLEAKFSSDVEKRSCIVDGSTEVGRHIAQVFTGLLSKEFGEDNFRVERGEKESESPSKPVSTSVGPSMEEV